MEEGNEKVKGRRSKGVEGGGVSERRGEGDGAGYGRGEGWGGGLHCTHKAHAPHLQWSYRLPSSA